jgi:hypothetical protein
MADKVQHVPARFVGCTDVCSSIQAIHSCPMLVCAQPAREKIPFEIRGFSLGWGILGIGVAVTSRKVDTDVGADDLHFKFTTVSFVEYFRTILQTSEAGGLSSLVRLSSLNDIAWSALVLAYRNAR